MKMFARFNKFIFYTIESRNVFKLYQLIYVYVYVYKWKYKVFCKGKWQEKANESKNNILLVVCSLNIFYFFRCLYSWLHFD